MCELSKWTCISIKPGAMKWPSSSWIKVASLRVPGAWTLAIIGPTIPMSAARISPVMTSMSWPPLSRRSKAALPCAAWTARLRVGESISGCHWVEFIGSSVYPSYLDGLFFGKRRRVLRVRCGCGEQGDEVLLEERGVDVDLRMHLLHRQVRLVVIGEGEDVAIVRTVVHVDIHIDVAGAHCDRRVEPCCRREFIPCVLGRVVVSGILDQILRGNAPRAGNAAQDAAEVRLNGRIGGSDGDFVPL